MRSITWRSGFTALEGLIVVAFFGLVMTLGALSLNTARARARDAVRLSDVSNIRAGLSLIWQQKSTYPTNPGGDIGLPGLTDVLTLDGFVGGSQVKPPVLVQSVPGGPNSGEYYWYKGGPNGYSVRFSTERDTALGAANVYYLHSTGFDTSSDLK